MQRENRKQENRATLRALSMAVLSIFESDPVPQRNKLVSGSMADNSEAYSLR
ncbi:hypothetical protein SLEP1_g28792 [Rubroshorea leprosula]|uniref:Uncharacterized protein n=1 Tax=Rubroshorea leprosula TaxID=152421 RepID=A0AAV5K6U5_9ROSI|nr:hypothetical protein SLEP1_g28792 [Rubroshorea leprosula]